MLIPTFEMSLIVQKFGGTSLKSPQLIRNAAKRILQKRQAGDQVVVVVSAMGRMTDQLILLARRTVRQPPQRELDMLMTAGERISMSLLAMSLDELGVPAISFTGSQCGIITTSDHTEARIVEIRGNRIREELAKGKVVIVAGFQGVSREREVTTLGRGGSDTTAVALAASLGAQRCEILTDVDGLFTADPRVVPQARLLPVCSYEEALELASLGAKMQARSIEVAKRYRVELMITSSLNDSSPGTLLVPESELNTVTSTVRQLLPCEGDDDKDAGSKCPEAAPVRAVEDISIPRTQSAAPAAGKNGSMSRLQCWRSETMEKTIIRGIASQDGYHCFRASGSWQRMAEKLSQCHVPLRFFNFSEQGVTFLCQSDKAPTIRAALDQLGVTVSEKSDISIVSAVGDGITSCWEVIPQFLETLNKANSEALYIGSSSLSITVAIPTDQKQTVARMLHERFIEESS